MAIDSRNKRFSFVNFGQSTGVLANPDGSVEAIDRAMALGLYGGINFASIMETLRLLSPAKSTLQLSAPGTATLSIVSEYL